MRRVGANMCVARAAASVMVEHLTEEQIAEFKEAFSVFDEDGGGTIETSELKELFKRLGHDVSDEEIDAIVEEYDADHNGEIDFNEFLDMMVRQMSGASRSEFLREAFKALVDEHDKDHVTVDSLKAVFDKTQGDDEVEVSKRQVAKMIKDVAGGTALTYAEFKGVFLQLEKSL